MYNSIWFICGILMDTYFCDLQELEWNKRAQESLESACLFQTL